jgi:type IV pilus assembly protein PilA
VSRVNQKKTTRREFGFSLIELLIVIAIILIILAVAMPRLGRARMYSQEMAAIKTITTIHTAQAQYFSQFGKFAGSLVELGPPSTGQATAASADLISGDLALGEKSGYKFVMQLTPTGYSVNANPIAYNTTGSRTFYSDQNLIIRNNFGQDPATPTSPELK